MTAPTPALPEPARILVVDDDPHNCAIAASHLGRAGYQVVTVPSGVEGLALAEQSRFNLVLLDVRMEGLDGIEVCRKLRALPGYTHTPIVLITAFDDADFGEAARAAGADDFLTKPLRRSELVLRVTSLLRIRALHQEVETAHAVVRDQRDELLHAQELRRKLAAMIVHDLKGPLAAIVANTHFLVEETASDAVAQDALQDVMSAADLMDRMVRDFLDVERSNATNGFACQPLPIALGDLMEKCARAVRSGGERTITVDAPADARQVVADADLLRRVLMNLLDNSAKYAPRNTEIRLESRLQPGGAVRISVRDRGPGVPEALRESIWEPYRRLESNDGARARSSYGLGLAFCRLAVLAHGGRIWVDDNQPSGAVFCVELPPPA